MRQLYDNWLVFQQEQLAVHGWMARSGWPGEWAEAWAAAVGRRQEMLTSPPSLTIGPFSWTSFLSIFQSNIQGLCHWNPTPCSLVGPILLPLETPPLVFIVCAATPCLRLECLDDFTSAGELRDGQIVKMIISGRNWHRLAFFLKGQDYLFFMNHFLHLHCTVSGNKKYHKENLQNFYKAVPGLGWVGGELWIIAA